MKILITSFTYPPNKDGVAEATRSMAEGILAKGHEVIVATAFHKDRKEGKQNGVEVVAFQISNQGIWKIPSGLEAERFSRFVLSCKPDILINHCWDAWPAVLSERLFNQLSCRKIQVSHGFTQHIWTPYFKPFFGFGQLLKGLLWTVFKFPGVAESYDAVVFLSECRGFGRFLDHTICSMLKHPGIYIIPNSVNIHESIGDGLGFRNRHKISQLMVLCVANYCERKNQALAVRAFRKSNIPGSTLVFIGSAFNEYSENVMKLDESLGHKSLCRTIFLEGISRIELQEAFEACDLFLLTAKQETQPIVLIEAMSTAKPWISTPTGCVSDMEGGIIAKGCDKISEALTDLSKNSQSRIRLGKQGRDSALEKYNRTQIAKSWDDFISSL